jgi:hypothetical protein
MFAFLVRACLTARKRHQSASCPNQLPANQRPSERPRKSAWRPDRQKLDSVDWGLIGLKGNLKNLPDPCRPQILPRRRARVNPADAVFHDTGVRKIGISFGRCRRRILADKAGLRPKGHTTNKPSRMRGATCRVWPDLGAVHCKQWKPGPPYVLTRILRHSVRRAACPHGWGRFREGLGWEGGFVRSHS